MKRLMVTVITAFLLFGLFGCNETVSAVTDNDIIENQNEFEYDCEYSETYMDIFDYGNVSVVIDPLTGVQYFAIRTSYGFSLSPRMNADGTLMVCENY